MSATWIEPDAVDVPPALRTTVGGHPLVAELLARRGVIMPEAALGFLDPRHYRATPASQLPGVEAAVARLAQALHRRESVVIWGDFDVDGQTATAILLATLTQLGFQVSFYIPHRVDESHGLNRPALEELLRSGVDLLVTCDCGISDTAELEFCRQQGLDVIVTDHHDVPPHEVPAPIVVNPKYLPMTHPLYHLCGAGVAFKVVEGLLTHFHRAKMAEELLDLVALGTIADVVALVGENRYLVQRGLPALAAGKRVGLQVLTEMAHIALSEIDTEPVAYELVPALNAAGRLASATLALELLLTSDRRRAEELASQVLQYSEERRYQTRLAEGMALDMIDAMPRPLPPALVLAHRHWHPGVIGIVAGRLTELFHRPAVLIWIPESGVARGSARSVPQMDIHHAIAQQRDLLVAEGGHAMAAGFGILPEHIEEFQRRLVRTIEEMTQGERPAHTIHIDAWVDWGDVTLGLCDELYRLAPFGEGNPTPILASRRLSLVSVETLGERGTDWRLRLADQDGLEHEVIWWHGDRALIPHGPMDVAFTLRPDVYSGMRRLQLMLVDIRRTPAIPIEFVEKEKIIHVIDRRQASDPRSEMAGWLEKMANGEPVMCWGEGRAVKEMVGLRRRDQIRPAETLVVWTIPPGPDEFRAVLEKSGASRLVLIYGDQPQADVNLFLTDLLGLIKFTLRHKGNQANVETLAGVLAQRRGTILAGLKALAELGGCTYDVAGPDEVIVHECSMERVTLSKASAQPALNSLRMALAETAAYRRYAARATLADVLPEGYIYKMPGT